MAMDDPLPEAPPYFASPTEMGRYASALGLDHAIVLGVKHHNGPNGETLTTFHYLTTQLSASEANFMIDQAKEILLHNAFRKTLVQGAGH